MFLQRDVAGIIQPVYYFVRYKFFAIENNAVQIKSLLLKMQDDMQMIGQGKDGYGHGGAGTGAGWGLHYFPGKNSYAFLATNIGTLIDEPLARKANDLKIRCLMPY